MLLRQEPDRTVAPWEGYDALVGLTPESTAQAPGITRTRYGNGDCNLHPVVRPFVVVALLLSHLAIADADSADDSKSEVAATSMSIGGTLLPAAMLAGAVSAARSNDGKAEGWLLLGGVVGLALLPSAGMLYARPHFTVGMTVRAAGLGIATFGAWAFADSEGDVSSIFWTGIGVMGVGAALDIIAARGSAREWNDDHGGAIRPAIVRIDHQTTVGISGTF